MRREMDRWLANYERTRTSDYGQGQNEALLSSRFDLPSMSWPEIREIPIPELGEDTNFGKSFVVLRKSWYAYKRSCKDGFPASYVAFRILRIQKALGIP